MLWPLLVAFAAFAAGVGIFFSAIRPPRSREEKERRRRIDVHVAGRMTEASILQSEENLLHYTYSVAGVRYHTSQDLTPVLTALPVQPHTLVGPCLAKYHPKNPANSIVICEHWSGLPTGESK